MVRNYM